MMVCATAGHVDHGKSTLVRALTGSDPDRLPAEKLRGLTIELGYCWTTLVTEGASDDVAFVDVPGHERFVATTLAGLGPVPAVMFVVAADDPWMPQAAEHLAALDALGVGHGVLVVTRADLADPAPALARARDELARTSLAQIPDVVVSGRTGAGLDELRGVLARTARSLPTPDPSADVRLWLDRSFHVRGTGTVVTGTLQAGTITVGDRLALDAGEVRVRGLQTLERTVGSVAGVARVAVSLGGRVPDRVRRDAVLVTPGAFERSAVVVVAVRGEGTPPERPLLHIGATSTATYVRPLDLGFARLTLDRPLPLRSGDRALLRDPGSRRVWGIDVLALQPAPLRRRGAAVQRAEDLREGRWSSSDATKERARRDHPTVDVVLSRRLLEAAATLHLNLTDFDAPDAEALTTLGLNEGDLAELARFGEVLRVDPRTVLLPGADDRAAERLAELDQPFTTSQARTALATSRRVILPLLAHLDRTGRTVRLHDDRRRIRRS